MAEYHQDDLLQPVEGEFFCSDLDGQELPQPRVIKIAPHEQLPNDFLFSNPLFDKWLSQMPGNTTVYQEEFSDFQAGTVQEDIHDTDIPDKNAIPNTEGLLKKDDIVVFRSLDYSRSGLYWRLMQ